VLARRSEVDDTSIARAQANPAGGREVSAVNALHQSRFSCAGFARQTEDLAFGHRERDVFERADAFAAQHVHPEVFVQSLDVQNLKLFHS
jgi:hypothetical protein